MQIKEISYGNSKKKKTLNFFPMQNFVPHEKPEGLIADMILESVGLVVNFTHKYHCQKRKNDIAVFQLNDFCALMLRETECSFRIYKNLIIEIDLNERECVNALLSYDYSEGNIKKFPNFLNSKEGYKNLTMNEVLILIWFNLISHSHVKIHALGNWAVDLESDTRNSFDKRQSLCTVLYNYFGKKFPFYASKIFYELGIFPCELKEMDLVFNHAISQGALPDSRCPVFKNSTKDIYKAQQQHRCMTSNLFQHSRHVRFVTRLRKVFRKLFDENTGQQFLAINGEALFVGGILHSLDHCWMEDVLKDPF